GYELRSDNQIKFRVGAYNETKPLVINPAISYTKMLGGNGAEAGFRVAVDAAGSVYVTGVTTSTNFPTTPGAFQTAPAGGSCSNGFTPIPCTDVFVAKLNAVGTELMYVTYFGGSGLEEARDIAVDAAGNAYITGKTASLDLPTANALQRANGAISLVKSTDGGNTWRAGRVGLPLDNVSALAVDPLTPTTVYAVAAGRGVYKSSNGGASWTASNAGMDNIEVRSLAIDPTNPSTIYAGAVGRGVGVFKSTDGGRSWIQINSGLSAIDAVFSMAIDPVVPATLYIAVTRASFSRPSGIYKSVDGGNNWNLSGELTDCGDAIFNALV